MSSCQQGRIQAATLIQLGLYSQLSVLCHQQGCTQAATLIQLWLYSRLVVLCYQQDRVQAATVFHCALVLCHLLPSRSWDTSALLPLFQLSVLLN